MPHPLPVMSKRCRKLAAGQQFLKDWKLVGSMKLLGSLEEGSKVIRASLEKSLLRSSRELG